MSENNTIISRLDRFENKLDKLADAVLTIARVEERQSQHSRTLERVWGEVTAIRDDVGALKGRVVDIESRQAESKIKLSIAERIFWLFASSAIGGGAWFFGG